MGGLLYIGAGTDLRILDIFKDETMYVFVDSLPRTEFGHIRYLQKFRTGFIPELKSRLKEKGFRKTGHIRRIFEVEANPIILKRSKRKYFHPGLLVFSNGPRTLYYFYSCPYPEPKNRILTELISLCDKLYVAGHEPEDNVILKMKKPITFIGSEDTIYTPDECDGLFYQIIHWNDVEELIKDVYSVEEEGDKCALVTDDMFLKTRVGKLFRR